MDGSLLLLLLSLTGLLGLELLRRVPPRLHTPLMSGANALSGVVVLGAIAAAGDGPGASPLALLAVALAAVNVVGGYLVTDRMLRFFGTERRRD
ncbi:MAG: NAD(P) transhydrogenase subunit alpha [Puniceicoccales bacterium]|jgi:NAD(P) transhydrogenase subunit alpha|nr:NAD(P) transhydrogenase subunit alpha [Puniceicoccales bacterium]